jgi:hypothetical protein
MLVCFLLFSIFVKMSSMKVLQKVALGFAAIAVAGIIIYVTGKRCDTKHMLDQIADEGYETATDVLFPGKSLHGRHLRYGPVIPGRG